MTKSHIKALQFSAIAAYPVTHFCLLPTWTFFHEADFITVEQNKLVFLALIAVTTGIFFILTRNRKTKTAVLSLVFLVVASGTFSLFKNTVFQSLEEKVVTFSSHERSLEPAQVNGSSHEYLDILSFKLPEDWRLGQAPNTAGLRDRMYFEGEDESGRYYGKIGHFSHSYLLRSRTGLRSNAIVTGEILRESLIRLGEVRCSLVDFRSPESITVSAVCAPKGSSSEILIALSSPGAEIKRIREKSWEILNSIDFSAMKALPRPQNIVATKEIGFKDLL